MVGVVTASRVAGNMNATPSSMSSFRSTAERLFATLLRAFHQYAAWLVSITWKRFLLLSLLLLILAGVLSRLPPFSWKRTETVVVDSRGRDEPRARPAGKGDDVHISIGSGGIRIAASPSSRASDATGGAASPTRPATGGRDAGPTGETVAAAGETGAPGPPASPPVPRLPGPPSVPSEAELRDRITITLPDVGASEDVRRAVEEAKAAIAEAIADARDDANDDAGSPVRVRTIRTSFGDGLPELAFFWIIASAIVKFTYKGQLRAEARAAVASETAEAETLKRQVVEARMAAMQAQVEPHFLFNTLASIDHLIETAPARASKMQKDLIALLRASMPTMREGVGNGLRDLRSELAVVRPYLEILKVRMDERLDAAVDIPAGLESATFPPMMLQSLVENAIKHGLEPKPDGGSLRVKAEVVDGALVVSVRDTGLGFGAADTHGTGVGLANIRERLQLLYGSDARLEISANQPAGTVATVTVPYRTTGTTGGTRSNGTPGSMAA